MPTIVCDSGPLISFSDTCLVSVLGFLRQRGGNFTIPKSVEQEIVSTPIKITRYAFSAVRLHKTIDDNVLKVVDVDFQLVNRIVNSANNVFAIRGKPIRLIHAGEAACLAAYAQFKCDALAIDEKTTRLLIEDPELLQENMSIEYNSRVAIDDKKLAEFDSLAKGVKLLRSADLLTVAAKRGYFKAFGKHEQQAYGTAITALKNAGCSLSDREVTEYQSIKLI